MEKFKPKGTFKKSASYGKRQFGGVGSLIKDSSQTVCHLVCKRLLEKKNLEEPSQGSNFKHCSQGLCFQRNSNLIGLVVKQLVPQSIVLKMKAICWKLEKLSNWMCPVNKPVKRILVKTSVTPGWLQAFTRLGHNSSIQSKFLSIFFQVLYLFLSSPSDTCIVCNTVCLTVFHISLSFIFKHSFCSLLMAISVSIDLQVW